MTIESTILNSIAWCNFDKPSSFDLERIGKAAAAMMTFKTKAEYLQWVKDWKAQYAELSKESRKAKKARKQSLPTYSPDALQQVWTCKGQARALLWLRKRGKGEAKQQRATAFAVAQS